jgi:hypothetical protein
MAVHQDVLRFEVPVHDPGGVCVLEGIGDLDAQLRRLAEAQPPLPREVRQRHAFHQVADDVDHVVVAPDLVHTHDVRMSQLGRRPRLAQELLDLGRLKVPMPRNLHRHPTVQLPVPRLPHRPERATAEFLDELEVTDVSHARGLLRRSLGVHQAEPRPARGALDLRERLLGGDFDPVAAVRTPHPQRSGRGLPGGWLGFHRPQTKSHQAARAQAIDRARSEERSARLALSRIRHRRRSTRTASIPSKPQMNTDGHRSDLRNHARG